MAGEPSLFLVYKDFSTTEKTGDSWYGTQDDADDAATDKGADFTAHQGAVKAPNDWLPGWIYNPTDDTWRELGYDDLDTLGKRKFAATSLFDVLDEQEAALSVKMGIPTRVAGRVRDILSYARWAAYSIFTSGTWTPAQQIAWAGAMLTGPSDATSMDMLIQKSSALSDAEVPTTTSAWVAPADGARSTLGGAKAASARWNTDVGDLTIFNPGDGRWITTLA